MWQRIGRLLYQLTFLFVFLLLLIRVLIEFESVQNWLINKTTNYLSKEWNTEVNIDHVSFSLFSSLQFKGFYVEDNRQDTLLYVDLLEVKIKSGLMGFVRQDIQVDEIHLHDGFFHHYIDTTRLNSNMDFIVDYFKNEQKDTINKKSALLLDVSDIVLHHVNVLKTDLTKGENIDAYIHEGKLKNMNFIAEDKFIEAESLTLDSFYFQFIKSQRQLPPPTNWVSKWAETPDSSYVYFDASIHKIKGKGGHFRFIDETKEFNRIKHENTMDFTDMEVSSIQAEITDFHVREDLQFKGILNHLSGKEKSGFQIVHAESDDVKVTCQGLHLYNMEVRTPTSILGDRLEFNYRRNGYLSFLDFVNDVNMKGNFVKGSKISMEDIFTFAPELQSNKLFYNNRNEVLEVEGEVRGRINRLTTKEFYANIGNDLKMKGKFRFRDLAIPGEQYLDFELEEVITSIHTVRHLVPDFKAPEQFDKLGRLVFEGRFNGFITDFVADGYLKTNLGDIRSNINLKGEGASARYSGALDLIDFDLAEWTGNKDFGLANFSSKINNGTGLKGEDIKADLEAAVTDLTFRGYKYQFLNIGGKFDKKKFDGTLDIKDENIDLVFEGLVDFNDKIPLFNFKAKVNEVHFQKLNLIDKNIVLKADLDFDLKGVKAQDFEGKAEAQDVVIMYDTIQLNLDSLYGYSQLLPNKERKVVVHSDVLNGEIEGKYNLDQVVLSLQNYLVKKMPRFSNKFNIKAKKEAEITAQKPYYSFEIFLSDSKNFTQLISDDLELITNSSLNGFYSYERDSLLIDLAVEQAIYKNLDIQDIFVQGIVSNDESFIDLGVYNTIINDSLAIKNITLSNTIQQDWIDFKLNAQNFEEFLDNLNIEGSFTLDENNLYQLTFNPSDLVIYNSFWSIENDNYIKFDNNYIETKNFIMNNQDLINNKIALNDIENKGLSLSLNDFGLSFVNQYITYDKLKLDGNISLDLAAYDLFNLKEIELKTEVDSFTVNDDYYGKMVIEANAPDFQSQVEAQIHMVDGIDKSFHANGIYNPPHLKENPNYFDINMNIQNYPLNIGEYFIGEQISNTQGKVSAKLTLEGTPTNADLNGLAKVKNGATTIDYLQTRIFVPNDTVMIYPTIFDFSGMKMYDKEGNEAFALGGITHDRFKNFGLDVVLESPRFIALDTKEGDNELFYGRGVGKMRVAFTGDFKNTNIDVQEAITDTGTKIILPFSTQSSTDELSFVTFKDYSNNIVNNNDDLETQLIEQLVPEESRGLDLTMNLTITPQAEIQMIFDEQTGDILKGKGNANMQIDVTREGDFEMYGTYVVEEGNYLFTLLNLVNKPFNIQKGGTIKWTGDPYKAIIDLEAKYANLSTTPYNFIIEYLNTDIDKSAAKQATQIDLKMYLTGELFKPDIDFDIGFPQLRGRLKNFTDSKLRIVRDDKNELNRQVLGLIAFGGFIPSDNNYNTTGVLDGSINTLSEMLSNQLSIYLSELLSEVVTGLDFDINYRYYEWKDLVQEDLNNFIGNEVEIRFSKRLLNNRLIINAGSNINANSSGSYLAGDLLIEYSLTDDGRFRLRFFQQTDQTLLEDRRFQTGVGISYSRDFDTFGELFRRKKKREQNTIFDNYDEFLENLRKTAEESR